MCGIQVRAHVHLEQHIPRKKTVLLLVDTGMLPTLHAYFNSVNTVKFSHRDVVLGTGTPTLKHALTRGLRKTALATGIPIFSYANKLIAQKNMPIIIMSCAVLATTMMKLIIARLNIVTAPMIKILMNVARGIQHIGSLN